MSHFIRKSSQSRKSYYNGKHRFEHWYRDNTVYFITARCRDRFPAFESDEAKQIFWDRFEHYANAYGFAPWVTSLVGNHYHTLGYLRVGENLPLLMQRLHGSTAKLVNDFLPARRKRFWSDERGTEYFDGCLRSERQCRRAYRYTLTQCKRHGICENWVNYPHTRVAIEVDRGVKRALELKAFLEGVPYKRYLRNAARPAR